MTYYRLLASAVPGGFDVAEAARLELDWWQARCEAVHPEQYGVTVARADAMAYRDALGQTMTDPDWSEIECRLRRAYWSLKAAVAGGGQ